MLIFDLETDGLLDHLTKIHCLAIYDTKTDTAYLFDPQSRPISEGIQMLLDADGICGHNIIGFDIPAIQKLYPFEFRGEVVDTLVISRVTYPDIRQGDYGRYHKGILPPKLIGSYSLKAWGYRMEVFKGDFGETTDWQQWTPDMSKYCLQDVHVTWNLYRRMKKARPLPPTCFYLEHRVAEIISKQERNGFAFDVPKAEQLLATLGQRRAELQQKLIPMFKPWYVPDGKEFIPKKDNKRYHYVAGCKVQKIKLIEFNPNSRQHVAKVLKEYYGWEPIAFTENSGEPKIDDEILSSLPWPEAQLIGEYMMLQKRIGQIADGDKAWFKYYNILTGKIHGAVITNGAVTGRMTHHSPNMAQVPSVDAPYGAECRGCFKVRPGFKLVGCDASGLEARCLSHFMATYDGGAYIDIILNGKKEDGTDVHGRNMKALGLPKHLAKRWFYAWCYGAGDDLLGEIAGGDKALGAKLRKKFIKAFPAIGQLIEAVQERKLIRGLDGRTVPVRAKHSALNTLLQGAGAVIMKQALVFCDDRLKAAGIEYYFVANVHDEFQIEVREDQAEQAGEIARQAIVDAGTFFQFRCPLDAEYKIGDNWADTH